MTENRIEYKHGIFIEERDLRELDLLLHSYFPIVLYVIKSVDGITSSATSVDEVLQYNNTDRRRIEYLEIITSFDADTINENPALKIEFNDGRYYKNTICCNFFEDYTEENHYAELIEPLDDFFNRIESEHSWIYSRRITVIYLLIVILFYIVCFVSLMRKGWFFQASAREIVLMLFTSSVIIAVVETLLEKARYFFFPSAVFYWQHEKKVYRHRLERGYYFLTAIISVIVNILGSLIVYGINLLSAR